MRIVDLTHPINDLGPCTFSTSEKKPRVTFEEGDAHGISFITSKLDNLYSNVATHIDLPGHMVDTRQHGWPSVGEIPLDHFIGDCIILDFSQKAEVIADWFDPNGVFKRSRMSEFGEFIALLRLMAINEKELLSAVAEANATIESLKGILIHTGLSALWQPGTFESWEHQYFYAPYLSADAVALILRSNHTFIGIDAFQLEDPICNLRGDELPLIYNEESFIEAKQGIRTMVRAALRDWRLGTIHSQLLSNKVVIYENLQIPPSVAGRTAHFSGPPLNLQLAGLCDNALARPYLLLVDAVDHVR